MITVHIIKGLNAFFNDDVSVCKDNLLESALSSHHYYDETKDKISSIIRGVIKNHPFKDGNKRTTIAVLMILQKEYNLKILNDSKLEDIIVLIAENNFSVEDISGLLFK